MSREEKKLQRKRQLQRRLLLAGVVVLVIISVICLIARFFIDKKNETEVSENTAAGEIIETEDQGTEISLEEKLVLARETATAAGAPEGILELLDKNPETVDFVMHYEEVKDNPPADTIGDVGVGEIPHLLQWDERWGYQSYGDSTIASSGCGPTCMSMIIAGLTGDTTATPYVMAEYAKNNGYLIKEGGTYALFMQAAAEAWGITVLESLESESLVIEELAKGNPIVCNLEAGEYFTDVGHFIILTGYEDGMVTVIDPFSIENTDKTWAYSDIKDQIIGMWVYWVE